jgi:hypothetical protein
MKSQLTSAELAGVRAENESLKASAKAHETWRQFTTQSSIQVPSAARDHRFTSSRPLVILMV